MKIGISQQKTRPLSLPYTYDAENQLIRVDKPGVVAEYRYDPLGRRIEKVVNGVSIRYTYDNEDIAVEVDGTNTAQAFYLHGPGIDEPLSMGRFGVGGGTFVFHADGLGSITHLTSTTGTVVRSYTYDSFGRLVTQTGTVTNPYTYTGRELDPESGLYYYRARYYDPIAGRFLTEDPVGGLLQRPLLLNAYPYVGNSPINNVDPDGQALLEATLLFLAGQAAAIAIAYGGRGHGGRGQACILTFWEADPIYMPMSRTDRWTILTPRGWRASLRVARSVALSLDLLITAS